MEEENQSLIINEASIRTLFTREMTKKINQSQHEIVHLVYLKVQGERCILLIYKPDKLDLSFS
jgi:hypothetical protein